MNAKRMGLLASLAIVSILLGSGFIASAQETTCVPKTLGYGSGQNISYCPISEQPYFINSYNGQVNNLITSGNALSDLGTWISANLGSLLILAIVITIVLAIADLILRARK